jgi:hypothetical protein
MAAGDTTPKLIRHTLYIQTPFQNLQPASLFFIASTAFFSCLEERIH